MKLESAKDGSISDYISRFPKPTKRILQKIRRTIRRAAPEASETISYQIPTFVYHGNLVHFAAWTKHVSFYPTSSGIQQFQDELKNYKTSRGTVQFPFEKPIPYDLIRRITEYRVTETEERLKNRKK